VHEFVVGLGEPVGEPSELLGAELGFVVAELPGDLGDSPFDTEPFGLERQRDRISRGQRVLEPVGPGLLGALLEEGSDLLIGRAAGYMGRPDYLWPCVGPIA